MDVSPFADDALRCRPEETLAERPLAVAPDDDQLAPPMSRAVDDLHERCPFNEARKDVRGFPPGAGRSVGGDRCGVAQCALGVRAILRARIRDGARAAR